MNYQSKYLKYKNKYLSLKNQIGGTIIPVSSRDKPVYFILYIFTKDPLNLDIKEQFIALIQLLYGEITEITPDIESTDFYLGIYKEDIITFVHEKGAKYRGFNNITTIRVNQIPTRITINYTDLISDPDLTREEYAMRDKLVEYSVPLKLVPAQHGLSGQNSLLIGFELVLN